MEIFNVGFVYFSDHGSFYGHGYNSVGTKCKLNYFFHLHHFGHTQLNGGIGEVAKEFRAIITYQGFYGCIH